MPRVLEDLTEEERYLFALLQDHSGIDIAEFLWVDETSPDSVYRCWDFQIPWYRCEQRFQIDQCARSIGKSHGIQMRAFAFAFTNPGEQLLLTAPEMVHLDPTTKLVEQRLLGSRITREMLKKSGNSNGIRHKPFEVEFVNGAQILSRIPQKDGKGVKGMHPKKLELDEAQDFPEPGWVELGETLKFGNVDATWRAHGVSKGMHDRYYKATQDPNWFVHRLCLPEGTLVYGVDGPFEIQKAQLGAMVWSTTREGQLVQRPVTAVLDNGERATWCVSAKGGLALETTPNHPYLILARAGTRRTRRTLSFEWVEAQDLRPGDYIIGCRELDSTGMAEPPVEAVSAMLVDHSPVREVPDWVWQAPRATQFAFLAGYLMGDGSLAHQRRGQDPWQVSTASLRMAKQLRALCHYLGIRTSRLVTKLNGGSLPASTCKDIHGFYAYPDNSWFAQVPLAYSAVRDGLVLEGLDKRLIARRVETSAPSGRVVHTYDITVEEHHNYIAEGVVVHNTAMHRPDWTKEEREAKAEFYGSREHPDYRRNILGLHGDLTNPLFVLHRLMACVDVNDASPYNQFEYYKVDINDNRLQDSGMNIEDLLDFPVMHKSYQKTWVGMDIGLTDSPSVILIFAEEPIKDLTGQPQMRLKLIAKILLRQISSPDQRRVLGAINDFYKPERIAIDETGMGKPIYQEIVGNVDDRTLASVIKGFDFGSKVIIGWDMSDPDFTYDPQDPDENAVKAPVLEYSTDILREQVDLGAKFGTFLLPHDDQLIKEFSGTTFVNVKQATKQNPYGKQVFSKNGGLHSLDAARMAILGWKLNDVDAMLKWVEDQEPVLDYFLV